MKKCSFVFASILLALPPLAAQVSNPSIVPRATAPTACTTLPLYVLTTNGDLYGDNGSGVCKILSTPTSALSGSGTATHLPIWSAGSTLGDSPATFDGTTFVFPNPFSVQAHSAFGVGSAVDSGNWQPDLGGPALAVANFTETSTTAAGVSGGAFDVTWNPIATNSTSAPFALGSSLNVNLDGQAGTSAAPINFIMNLVSNGNTTGLATLQGGYNGVFVSGTAPIASLLGWQDDIENDGSATIGSFTAHAILQSNAGTVNVGGMVGENVVMSNTGSTIGMIGLSASLTNTGSGNTTGDVLGSLSKYYQDSSSASPTDFLGFVSAIEMSAGTFRGLGIAHFVADGGDSSITAVGTHAIPNYIGFDFEAVTAPAHVINNEYGVKIEDVTQGDNNLSIKTGAGRVDEGDIVSPGILTLANGSAHITTATGEGWQFNCSDCDTPLTEGATCTAAGDHAGALAIAIDGGIQCFGVSQGGVAVFRGSGTYTTATSDSFTVTGATASSYCVFAPSNSTAAATTVLGYVSSVTTNSVTITHAATVASGGTVNIICTKN